MEPRFDLAKKSALKVLDELDIHDPQQLKAIEELCRDRGVGVRAESLSKFEGLLIRSHRLIVYRSGIQTEGRRRFTIGHELGHWEMHPELNQLKACTWGDIHGYRNNPFELEANTFSAELLMPERFLKTDLRYLSPTLDVVRRIAATYGMSLTASAVRLMDFVTMPTFVAFSQGGRLRWYKASCQAKNYFFLKWGAPLSDESLALTCMAQPDDPSEPVVVDSEAWFPDDRNCTRFTTYEESVELGEHAVTLSIITVDD